MDPRDDYNIEADEELQKSVFQDDKTQKGLNAPLKDPSGVNSENEEFLKMLIEMISDGKINLYRPNSLINNEVYDQLSEQEQGKVDLEAVNLLSAIREIQGLYENGFEGSFQIQNQVHRLRLIKERLEQEGGDLFII